MTQLTISEARKEFLDLPEKLARKPERAVIVTRRRQPVYRTRFSWTSHGLVVG